MNIFGMKISPKYECEYYFFWKAPNNSVIFVSCFARLVLSDSVCYSVKPADGLQAAPPAIARIALPLVWYNTDESGIQVGIITHKPLSLGSFPIQIICMVLFTTVHFNDNCGSSKMSLSHYEWTILILCHIWSLKYWIFLGHEGLVSRAVAIMMWSISPDKAPGIFVN